MKNIFLFSLILLISLVQSIKVTDFCYQNSSQNKSINCEENPEYKYDCSDNLCSIDQPSCHRIRLFSTFEIGVKFILLRFSSNFPVLNDTNPNNNK